MPGAKAGVVEGHPLTVRPEGLGLPSPCLLDGCLGSGLCLLGPLVSYPGSLKVLSQHLGILTPSQSGSARACASSVSPALSSSPVPSILPSIASSSTGSPVSLCPNPYPCITDPGRSPCPGCEGAESSWYLCLHQESGSERFFLLLVSWNQLPCLASFPELGGQRDTF